MSLVLEFRGPVFARETTLIHLILKFCFLPQSEKCFLRYIVLAASVVSVATLSGRHFTQPDTRTQHQGNRLSRQTVC